MCSHQVSPVKDVPRDWDYFYELSTQFDRFKAQQKEEKKNRFNISNTCPSASETGESTSGAKKDIKAALGAIIGGSYTANCNWLDDEWISHNLVEGKKYKTLTFRFGDSKLFKRFDKTDEINRDVVINKFVDALLGHPRNKDISGINLSNCLLPDLFLEVLAKKILQNPKEHLPKLQVLNLESNLLLGAGIVAISKVIKDDVAWRHLQVLMLENQKKKLTSAAEEALANAISCSPSMVVCSLKLRGRAEQRLVNDRVSANIDVLRLARRKRATEMGTLKERKRNTMELYFDKIMADDSGIDAVELVGEQKFLGLKEEEKSKAGAAFAGNTHVKIAKMVKLGLDNDFAKAMGKSLESNETIEKIVLDSNAITGEGIKALFSGLSKNSSVLELQVRHQSKGMASVDEATLLGLLEPNTTVIKMGVDVRNQLAKMGLDRKINANREILRKQRAQAKKAASSPKPV